MPLKFIRGGMYKHVSANDIHFVVTSPMEETDTSISFRCWYWNHFYACFQGEAEQVTIQKQDFHKWSDV